MLILRNAIIDVCPPLIVKLKLKQQRGLETAQLACTMFEQIGKRKCNPQGSWKISPQYMRRKWA
jgi:hypothetical protein